MTDEWLKRMMGQQTQTGELPSTSRYGSQLGINHPIFGRSGLTRADLYNGLYSPEDKTRFAKEQDDEKKKREAEVAAKKAEQDKMLEPGKGKASTNFFGGFRAPSPNYSLARRTLTPGTSSLLPGQSTLL